MRGAAARLANGVGQSLECPFVEVALFDLGGDGGELVLILGGSVTLRRPSRAGRHALSEPLHDLAPAPGNTAVNSARVADFDAAREQATLLESPSRRWVQSSKGAALRLENEFVGRHGGTSGCRMRARVLAGNEGAYLPLLAVSLRFSKLIVMLRGS